MLIELNYQVDYAAASIILRNSPDSAFFFVSVPPPMYFPFTKTCGTWKWRDFVENSSLAGKLNEVKYLQFSHSKSSEEHLEFDLRRLLNLIQ